MTRQRAFYKLPDIDFNYKGRGDNNYVLYDMAAAGSQELIEEFVAKVGKQKDFAFDTETTGLRWYRDNMLMAQLYTDDMSLTIPFWWGSPNTVPDIEWLEDLFFDSSLTCYMWNAKFDMHFFERFMRKDIDYRADIVDGRLLAVMLSQESFPVAGLKARAAEDLQQNMEDFSDLFTITDKRNMSTYSLPEIESYAAKDPVATYWEVKFLLDQLNEGAPGIEKVFTRIEKPLTKVLFRMERRGLVIDTGNVELLYDKYNSRMSKIEEQIYDNAECVFNIGSPAQFCDILERKGFPNDAFKLTPKSKKRKLDEGCIARYSAFAAKKKLTSCIIMLSLLTEQREISKYISTYIIPLRAGDTKVYDSLGKKDKQGNLKFKLKRTNVKLCKDGCCRIYPNFNQIMRTGRMSSSSPNIQNWPRPNRKKGDEDLGLIRQCVIAPRGYTVIDLDYSQLELRVLGHVSKEPVFIEAYEKDEDLHIKSVAKLFKIPEAEVTEEQRQMGKATTSFGVVFGMAPPTLAREHLGGDVEFAEKIINDYFDLHQYVHRFVVRTHRFAHKYGYVDTFLGRRRYLPGIHSDKRSHVSACERESVNTRVQGGAADLVKLAMIACDKSEKLRTLGVQMIIQVHDELLFYIPLDVTDEAVKEIKRLMDKFPVARLLLCPLKAEGGLGASWYEAH